MYSWSMLNDMCHVSRPGKRINRKRTRLRLHLFIGSSIYIILKSFYPRLVGLAYPDNAINMLLCKTCASMLESPNWDSYSSEDGPQTSPHHANSASLIMAASSGCRICRPLLHYCRRMSGSYYHCVSGPWGYMTWGKNLVERVSIKLKTFQGRQPFESEHNFTAFQSKHGEEIVEIQERDRKHKFKDGCQTATMWMQQCLDRHTKCRRNKQSSSYPTRLLQLNESKVRLVISSQGTISGPYAALSYCWGNDKAEWALTASNLARRCENDIALSDLPVAFQEAIAFARGLSIHYLWIDSLCIVQSGDEGKDWRVECSKIQNVYENCILNISLADGENPSQSYLKQNTNEIFYPFLVTTTVSVVFPPSRSSSSRPIKKENYLERYKGRFLITEENFLDKYLTRLHINSRAWVLQEQFLAPRVLSFGHGQAFWNCTELGNALESFPHSLRQLRPKEKLRSHPGKDVHEQQFFWKAMIERYADRQLTFIEKDKLIAFSAIAKRMATMTDSIYIAGHFWKQLPQSLPWQVLKPPGKCRQRKNTYVLEDGRQIKTPSWSWASMDGQIEMPTMSTSTRSIEPIADMVDFSLDLVDEANPYGQVVSASLVLRAHCAEIQWTGGLPTISKHSITLNDSISWNGYDLSFWWIIDDPKDDLQEGDRCAIVALSKAESAENLYGLVVREVQGSEMSVYARIGYYCIRGPLTLWPSMESWHGEKRVITLI